MKAHLLRMFESMRWADERMIHALANCPAAQAEALPLAGHLVAAEHVWLSRLEGRESRVAVWPTLTLAECEALAQENSAGYQEYLERRSDESLHEKVSYRTQNGQAWSTAVIDILTHVVIHGSYHRGQIAKILGRAATQVPMTDYIAYVREVGE
jgi:uncharacterized damage-inducible protein DinB